MALKQADAAVTAALLPLCLAGQKADVARAKKLGELRAEPNRAVAEACAAGVLKIAAA